LAHHSIEMIMDTTQEQFTYMKIGEFETMLMDNDGNAAGELMHAIATESEPAVRLSALASLTELDDVPLTFNLA
jgi:hypothetical protein